MSRIAALATLVLTAFAPFSLPAQDIPLPTEWSTHYAWSLVGNPEYEAGSQESDRALTAAHITILRAKSLEAARVREWWVPAEYLP